MKFDVEITVAGTVEANNAGDAITKLATVIREGLGDDTSSRPYGASMTEAEAHGMNHTAKTGRMASSASAWGTSGNLSIKPGGFFAKRLDKYRVRIEEDD